MSSGQPITVPKEQAEKIIDSQSQLVKITKDGIWDGQTINKAHIVSTDYDMERERAEAEKARRFIPKLNEPAPTPEQRKSVEAIKQKIRDKFRIKK
jgi:hypothetical protein